MIGLAIAVLISSVLGSLHCVGMCGPLALWASGVGAGRGVVGNGVAGVKPPRAQVWGRLTAYHLGRLITYMTAGLLAGLIGSLISTGGSFVGLQSLAARSVGGVMLALGMIRLAELAFPRVMKPHASGGRQGVGTQGVGTQGVGTGAVSWSHWISAWVARRRPFIQRLPGLARGLAAGALTTLLPCGWLYVFVLVAAGTGGVVSAMMVMFAFWLGTLPALTALVAGSFGVAGRIKPLLPLLGCLLLLASGLYTATGRAAADLKPLTLRAAELSGGEQAGKDMLKQLFGEPLPCCVED